MATTSTLTSNPGSIAGAPSRTSPVKALSNPTDTYKPGALDCGRGVQQALRVMDILNQAGIPTVVGGAKALVYYGAPRAASSWEITVPDHLHARAVALFKSAPWNEWYKSWPNCMPQPGNLLHTYPQFTLQGVDFFFYLLSGFENRISCDAHRCERSKSGVPYPKLEVFAQGLLESQQNYDLADLVDGMNLTEGWGDAHLDFSGKGLADYYVERTRRGQVFATEQAPGRVAPRFVAGPNLLARWQKIVAGKQQRIGIKLQQDRYETRYRRKGAGDPRLRNRDV